MRLPSKRPHPRPLSDEERGASERWPLFGFPSTVAEEGQVSNRIRKQNCD